MSYTRRVLTLWLMGMGVYVAPVVGQSLSVPTVAAVGGITVTITVSLFSQAIPISGVQFDLLYDSSLMTVSGTLTDSQSTLSKMLLLGSQGSSGQHLLIFGNNSNTLSNGPLVTLVVTLAPSVASGVYTIQWANLTAVGPEGSAVAMSANDIQLNVNSSGVLNSASLLGGAIAPGEVVTIVGPGIGPAAAVTLGPPFALSGTSVMFDGLPAPVLFASTNQINAIVPFAVAGNFVSHLTISEDGNEVVSFDIPVAPSAPGLFSSDSSGAGQVLAANADGSLNAADHPADSGSIIVMYATGGGSMNPPSTDGQVTAAVLSQPVLPASLKIGGVPATVLYAGAAPGIVSGVLQINAVIPQATPFGASAPVVLNIGGIASQSGLMISIRSSVPSLTAIMPATLAAGSMLTLTVTGTNFTAGTVLNVSGNGVNVNSVNVVSATQIAAVLDVSAAAQGVYQVTVSNAFGVSNSISINVSSPSAVPILTGLTPSTGSAGAVIPVALQGSNFTAGATIVTDEWITVSNVTLVSATQMTATFTIRSGVPEVGRNVWVVTTGGTSNKVIFNIN